jgi:hypothetical protein
VTVVCRLEGGPRDGESWTARDWPPSIVIAVTPDPWEMWRADLDRTLVPIQHTYYQRLGCSDIYVYTTFDPVQELINFARQIGLTLDEHTEHELRYLFRREEAR